MYIVFKQKVMNFIELNIVLSNLLEVLGLARENRLKKNNKNLTAFLLASHRRQLSNPNIFQNSFLYNFTK